MTTYHEVEISTACAAPIRLYCFMCGAKRWTYTTGMESITHLGSLYVPPLGGIVDNGIRQTGQSSADTLKITVAAELELARLFLTCPPNSATEVTLFGRHAAVSGEESFVQLWHGELIEAKFIDGLRCELVCSLFSARLSQTGLRATWTRQCPHFPFSAACGLDADKYKQRLEVQSVGPEGIVVSGASADVSLSGGWAEWEDAVFAGVPRKRGIIKHEEDRLTLVGGPASGLRAGAVISAYPGCNRSVAACEKYENLERYGGFPGMPNKNPFENSVY